MLRELALVDRHDDVCGCLGAGWVYVVASRESRVAGFMDDMFFKYFSQ